MDDLRLETRKQGNILTPIPENKELDVAALPREAALFLEASKQDDCPVWVQTSNEKWNNCKQVVLTLNQCVFYSVIHTDMLFQNVCCGQKLCSGCRFLSLDKVSFCAENIIMICEEDMAM